MINHYLSTSTFTVLAIIKPSTTTVQQLLIIANRYSSRLTTMNYSMNYHELVSMITTHPWPLSPCYHHVITHIIRIAMTEDA